MLQVHRDVDFLLEADRVELQVHSDVDFLLVAVLVA